MDNQIVPVEMIQEKIYNIRGYRVILDSDLSELYGITTKRLNEQMSRNKELFPDDFVFQLTKEEVEILKSQNETSSWGGIRKLPFAYTEYGAVHITHFIKTPKARQISVFVTRAFIQMRQMAFNYKVLVTKINEMENKYDSQFQTVFEQLKQLLEFKEKPKRPIGFVYPKNES